MTETPDLFAPQPRARNSDPATSHKAAAAFRGKPCHSHYVAIMGALWRPMSAREIAKCTGMTMEQVCRRLPELQQRGEVAPTGEERDGCRVWTKINKNR